MGIFLVSILAIIIGFLMVVWGLILAVLIAIKNIAKFFVFLGFSKYHQNNVQSTLGNANWTDDELALIKNIEHSKRPKIEQKARDKVYEGIIVFSSTMKAKYPNADKELFEKIESKLIGASDLSVFKEYEEMVKESHIRNS